MYIELRFYADDGGLAGVDRVGVIAGLKDFEHDLGGRAIESDDGLLTLRGYRLELTVEAARELTAEEIAEIKDRAYGQIAALGPPDGIEAEAG